VWSLRRVQTRRSCGCCAAIGEMKLFDTSMYQTSSVGPAGACSAWRIAAYLGSFHCPLELKEECI
jgi:hypothetical protein